MKDIARILLSTILIWSAASITQAATVKENPPKDRRVVEQILKDIGDKHWPEGGMKITEVGSIKTETTYFHVFQGEVKGTDMYRYLIFDNTPTYLGYYELQYPATDVEEGALIVYCEDEAGEGDGLFRVNFTDKGPPSGFMVSQASPSFVKVPQPEKPAEEEAQAATTTEEVQPGMNEEAPQQAPVIEEKKEAEYRDWHITKSCVNPDTGQKEPRVLTVYAKFVERDGAKNIIIMCSKNGQTASIPIGAISEEDKAYLAEFFQ